MQENGTSRSLYWMLTAICIGALMSHLTAGIINVALPNLAIIFEQEMSTIQWVTLGYLLVIASLLPMMGKLGDIVGHRNIHNTGYMIFTLGSILIAFAPTLHWVLFFRVFQAVGAAMFQATNIAIISMAFPAKQRGKALGILGTAVALGAMSGPMIGGLVVEWLPWQVLFIIHVPLAVVAIILAYRYIPKQKPVSKSVIDVVGAAFFALLVSLAMITLSYGNEWGWLSTNTMLVFFCTVLVFLLFIWWIRNRENPFININLFKNPFVSVGIFISCISFLASFCTLVVMPFYLQGILLFNPFWIGIIMMAYPIVLGLAGPLFGSLSDRYGTRRLTLLGLSIMVISLLWMASFGLTTSLIQVLFALGLLGLGMGMVTSPNYSLIMGSAPKEAIGIIGGMVALARNIGMVFGAAIGITLMNIWIPKQLGDITVILQEKNNQLYELALKGFSTVYLSTAAFSLLALILLWQINNFFTNKEGNMS